MGWASEIEWGGGSEKWHCSVFTKAGLMLTLLSIAPKDQMLQWSSTARFSFIGRGGWTEFESLRESACTWFGRWARGNFKAHEPFFFIFHSFYSWFSFIGKYNFYFYKKNNYFNFWKFNFSPLIPISFVSTTPLCKLVFFFSFLLFLLELINKPSF